MLSALKATELRQYFAIKSDLAAAVRDGAVDDIDFCLNELGVIRMHTSSDRLRRACQASMAGRVSRAESACARA